MNIVSFFDGMACGMIALNISKIQVDNYFSFEIDKSAIAVATHNNPNIRQMGDVNNFDISTLPKIDLFIGGSPCQGFSFSGNRLNFNDSRSKLFFNYVSALKQLQSENKNLFFLLENVKMKKEWRDIISNELGVEPFLICSSSFSAQKRKRYYWTNIPVAVVPQNSIRLHQILQSGITDTKLYLSESQIERGHKKHAAQIYKTGNKMGKVSFPTDTSKLAKTLTKVNVTGSRETNHVIDILGVRLLTTIERERLQTMPEGYTKTASKNAAWAMLGNGWTVDVIAHIFKGLTQHQTL